MKILLDTCTILWAVSASEFLTLNAKNALTQQENEVFVSPISCAEIACGCERGKIKLDRHWKLWFRHFIKLNQWKCIPIDLPILEEAYSLPPLFHADPADRILVATARVHSCNMVTGDTQLLNYPHLNSIW